METHPGEHWDMFAMTVLKNHKTPLSTQVEEGHLISNFKGGMILNQKGEWGQNLPPRLVVTDGRDGTERTPPSDEESRKNLADTGTKRGGNPQALRTPKGQELWPKLTRKQGKKKTKPASSQ